MTDLKKIVWLASYPKSGNTWFRAFLTALLDTDHKGIDINQLHRTTIASSRLLFDDTTGIASSDLSFDEIDRLRPSVYKLNATESTDLVYHKVHDAWQKLPDGTELFQQEVTHAVIYFIRNPLDVAVSFSNHLAVSIDKTIDILNDPSYAFCYRPDRLHNQLRQKLFTWSSHVKSWVDESRLPVFVMRYEDMIEQPLKTFSDAVSFIGLQYSSGDILKAVDQCSFENLKLQEVEKGFNEKNAKTSRFFRKGITGDWKNCLTENQTRRIAESHHAVMQRFGYL